MSKSGVGICLTGNQLFSNAGDSINRELVEAVFLVGEVAAELVAALRAWNSAALLLSFTLFFSLFLLVGHERMGTGG